MAEWKALAPGDKLPYETRANAEFEQQRMDVASEEQLAKGSTGRNGACFLYQGWRGVDQGEAGLWIGIHTTQYRPSIKTQRIPTQRAETNTTYAAE